MKRFLADTVIRALFLRRMWRQALPEDRWVYGILLAEIAIAAYLIWSLA